MKLFACVFTATICWGMATAGRLSNKYIPPNFAAVGAADPSQYPHYQGAAAAVSTPVLADPQYGKTRAAAQIPILRSEYNTDGSGNYNFGFETGNGIKRDESGHVQGSWPGSSLNVAGSYSYTGDDGKLYSVSYRADNNGFHAEGDHLPTPPPIPREIQETLHLHQHGGSQRGSSANYASPASYSSGGSHHGFTRNFAAASQLSTANVLAPHASYLPPHQGQGYNYGRHY